MGRLANITNTRKKIQNTNAKYKEGNSISSEQDLVTSGGEIVQYNKYKKNTKYKIQMQNTKKEIVFFQNGI